MIRHFVTSDLHCYHNNIINYSNRILWANDYEKRCIDAGYDLKTGGKVRISVESTQKMTVDLIEKINDKAKENDILWMVGDYLFAGYDYLDKAIELRKSINCKTIHFIWGNHDRYCLNKVFNTTHDIASAYINRQTGEYYIGIEPNKAQRHWQHVVFCHYCLVVFNKSHRNAIHCYGHSHANLEPWANEHMPNRRSLDIGVDNAFKILGDYVPFSLFDDILPLMDKKKGHMPDHYGED